LDFTWNARNKGKLGTLVAISSKSKKVLFRVHRLQIGKKKNHDESNKAMEGRAVEDLVKIIDEKKLQVRSVCHDTSKSRFFFTRKDFLFFLPDHCIVFYPFKSQSKKNLLPVPVLPFYH